MRKILAIVATVTVSVMTMAGAKAGDGPVQNLCKERWGADFEMQEHCINTQVEAYENVDKFMSRHGYADMKEVVEKALREGDELAMMATTCLETWSIEGGFDFEMVAHCIEQGEAAYLRLKKRS